MKIEEIIKYCETADLHQFVINYAKKDEGFEKAFISKFGPKKVSENKGHYAKGVAAAFINNSMKGGNRYREWEDIGFDAEDVADELQSLLQKADYYVEHKNYEEAILICEALIETIPDEWDSNFDYEGEVQVVYDEAIEKLLNMLKQNVLSHQQKEDLFNWYTEEQPKAKHEDVGLNTDLKALEIFFADTPEMLQKNLANMENRIQNSGSSFRREEAAINKITLLKNAGLDDESENAITQYIRFKDVRKLRLEKLLKEQQYTEAIVLIQEGIRIAQIENYAGVVHYWKEALLNIYELEKDPGKILAAAEELFYSNHNERKYYEILKKNTPKNEWLVTLERLLSKMDKGFFGFNSLKADIFIEHKMWDRLFAFCQKSGSEKLEEYEKYLKPIYAKEIFDTYLKYVEKQATITDQNAYHNVARVLKKMKKYEGGNSVVTDLVKKYREIYKRRKNMMKELEGV